MSILAIIGNGSVVNILVGNDESSWDPGEGFTVIVVPEGVLVNIGDKYTEGVFTPVTPPPPVNAPNFSNESAAYLATVRTTREQILNRLAGIGVAALVAGDNTTADAVVAARAALLDITTAPAVTAATTLDSLKAAVLGYYRAIIATTPDVVKKAILAPDA